MAVFCTIDMYGQWTWLLFVLWYILVSKEAYAGDDEHGVHGNCDGEDDGGRRQWWEEERRHTREVERGGAELRLL